MLCFSGFEPYSRWVPLTMYQQIVSTLASHIAEVEIVWWLVSTQNEYSTALNVRLVHLFVSFLNYRGPKFGA